MKIRVLKALLMALVFCAPVGQAFASITLTPPRIVFEDGDRFKELTLINTTKKTKTYDINWIYYKMIQDQEPPYEVLEKSFTEFDLPKHVVFTPRRFTLAPNGVQRVRFALRRPSNVPPGEYRAHLSFKGLDVDEEQKANAPKEGHFSAGVVVNVAFSIPVVFQAGPQNIQANIESLKLERNPKNNRLNGVIKIDRGPGVHGAIGHLYIYGAKNNLVGEISNAHIFSEIQSRTFTVPLITEDFGGSLRVVLKHYDKEKNKTFTERVFPIQ